MHVHENEKGQTYYVLLKHVWIKFSTGIADAIARFNWLKNIYNSE